MPDVLYFLFYLLRDREELTRAVENALPLSAPEFITVKNRVTNTIHATVLGMAAVSVSCRASFLGRSHVLVAWIARACVLGRADGASRCRPIPGAPS